MKKQILIFTLVALILILVILGLRFILGGPEDTWLCQNGQWVKHGNPASPMPVIPCGSNNQSSQSSPQSQLSQKSIIIISPQPNQTVKSPLLIEGQARGTWFFEAIFSAKLIDEENKELARTNVQATSSWMTSDFVSFKGEINFQVATTTKATLILEKANPSGLPQNEEKFEIPLILEPSETMKIEVYFNNDKLDPEFSCNKIFPVEREIPKIQAVGRTALEELLKGPTEQEKTEGYLTNINSGVKIQKLVIENDVAKVDFDEQLEFQVGGSCRVAAIRAQISETLKQFPTVKDVIISINSRTEDILQP